MVSTKEAIQARLEVRRREVGLEIDRVTDVVSTDFPGHYPGEDNSWNLAKFSEGCFVQFHVYEPDHIEFDLVGIDASIANALRRILIAEVPSMAIELVYSTQNTSVVQDEVLAQRLGLVPISAPIGDFEYAERELDGGLKEMHDRNTLTFELRVKCERNRNAPAGAADPAELYINSNVTSGMLKFVPKGGQAEFLAEDAVKVANEDILLAKLRPGQEIHCDCIAILGIGKDHAKFSPVAPASYRLMPTITLLEPITGRDADKFAKCFPKGVIKVKSGRPDDSPKKSSKSKKSAESKSKADPNPAGGGDDGEPRYAVVRNPRLDSVSRECLRHEEFQGKVRLGRRRDHFIFDVEGTGVRPCPNLVLNAIDLLQQKCRAVKDEIERQRGDTMEA